MGRYLGFICFISQFILFMPTVYGQFFTCDYCQTGQEYRITSTNGLNLRKEPKIDAEVIAKIPYGEIVSSCLTGDYRDFDGSQNGYWQKTLWQGYEGFIFSAYTELIGDKPKIIGFKVDYLINGFEGHSFRKDEKYVGLFSGRHSSEFEVRKIELSFANGDKFAKAKHPENPPLWIFRGIEADQARVIGGRLLDRRFYLGARFATNSGTIYIDGSLVKADSTSGYVFDAIDPYLIKCRKGEIDELILKSKLNSYHTNNYEPAIGIEFIGDIDGDNDDDILMIDGCDKGYRLLFCSSKHAPIGRLFKYIVLWEDSWD